MIEQDTNFASGTYAAPWQVWIVRRADFPPVIVRVVCRIASSPDGDDSWIAVDGYHDALGSERAGIFEALGAYVDTRLGYADEMRCVLRCHENSIVPRKYLADYIQALDEAGHAHVEFTSIGVSELAAGQGWKGHLLEAGHRADAVQWATPTYFDAHGTGTALVVSFPGPGAVARYEGAARAAPSSAVDARRLGFGPSFLVHRHDLRGRAQVVCYAAAQGEDRGTVEVTLSPEAACAAPVGAVLRLVRDRSTEG